MTTPPLPEMLSDMPVVKRRRLNSPNTDAVVLPDDIGELCSYLDDGDLAEDGVDLLPKQYDDHVQRKRQKIQALKAEKQALRRDLSRSRLVGRNLETDIGRLRRQRQRELSYERRAQRDIHAREEAVTSREQACGDLQETLLQLKAHLLEEIRFQEQSEVKRVVQGLVDHVELSATAIDLQTTQEDLEWSQILEKCWHDYAARVEKESHEVGEFVAVEQQLLTKRVGSLTTQLESTQRRLQEEEQAGAELNAMCSLLQQEVTCKSQWLTGFALNSMAMVNIQGQIESRMEAERCEWQQNLSHLQRERDMIQAEQSKKLGRLESEKAKVQEQLRVSQLSELNAQKQLQTSQKTAKNLKIQMKKLQAGLKTLQDDRKAVKCETSPSPRHVTFSQSLSPLVKTNSERLKTLRTNDFASKCTRDEGRN